MSTTFRGTAALLCALVTLMALPAATMAAPSHPSAFHSTLSSLELGASSANLKSSNLSRLLHSTSVGGRFHVLSTSQAPARQVTTPDNLAMQWPTNATNTHEGTIDATNADDPNVNLVVTVGIRSQGDYTAGKMAGGYAQDSELPVSSSDTSTLGFWLASYYPDAASATAMADKAATDLTAQQLTDTPCGDNCHQFAFTITGQSGTVYDFLYAEFAIGNVLGELLITTTDEIGAANTDAVGAAYTTSFKNAAAAVNAAVTGTPTTGTPSVTIQGFELDHSAKGKLAKTKSLKSGEKGTFLVLVETQNSTTDPTVSIQFTVKGKVKSTLKMKPAARQANDIIFGATKKFKFKKTTTVNITVKATLGSQADQGTTKFKVKVAKKK